MMMMMMLNQLYLKIQKFFVELLVQLETRREEDQYQHHRLTREMQIVEAQAFLSANPA